MNTRKYKNIAKRPVQSLAKRTNIRSRRSFNADTHSMVPPRALVAANPVVHATFLTLPGWRRSKVTVVTDVGLDVRNRLWRWIVAVARLRLVYGYCRSQLLGHGWIGITGRHDVDVVETRSLASTSLVGTFTRVAPQLRQTELLTVRLVIGQSNGHPGRCEVVAAGSCRA